MLIGELHSLRAHLMGLVDRVEDAVKAPEEGRAGGDLTPHMAPMAPGVDDLLDSTAGFDLAPMVVWEDMPAADQSDPLEAQPLDIETGPRIVEQGEAMSTATEILDLSSLADEEPAGSVELDETVEPADTDPAAAE